MPGNINVYYRQNPKGKTERCYLPKSIFNFLLTGLLQLAAFSFRTIKYWSGFAGEF
jgi:hypothetical protein